MCSNFNADTAERDGEWVPHILDDGKIIELLIRELYGDDPFVSIREMLQNAHDAAAKLASCTGTAADGRVDIELEVIAGRRCVIIRDNGVGMSRDDLRTKLLAVGESGKSEWRPTSNHGSVSDLKRIVTTQASAIGKYGIGFLASFILADEVVVRTRRYDRPAEEGWELTATLGRPRPPQQITLPDNGTEVRLFVRDRQTVSQEFYAKAEQILALASLEKYARRLMYFSDVPIYIKAADGRHLVSMEFPSHEDIHPEHLFGVLARANESYGAKALLARRVSFSFDDTYSDTRCHVFLYCWDNTSAQKIYGSAHIWVDNMLVEENVPDLLPKWAVNMTAFVIAHQLPIELNRRMVQRTSQGFISLRRFISKQCLTLLGEAIDTDFEKFIWEVWPVLHGTVLPTALLSYLQPSVSESNTDQRDAEEFLKEIGPKWPFNALVHNPKTNGYYKKTVSIQRISDATTATPIEIPFLLTSGTTDAALAYERLGKQHIIDVRLAGTKSDERRFGMGANHSHALLQVLNSLLKDKYRFHELAPDIGDQLSDEELANGWSALSEAFRQRASYASPGIDGGPSVTERYLVSVRRFDPDWYPAVAAELAGNDDQMTELSAAIDDVIKRFPQFRDQLKSDLLGKTSPNDRVYSLILNAKNPLLKNMAEAVRISPAMFQQPWFNTLLVQQIEDARTDFYGGSLMGRTAQDAIYSNVRMPLYLEYWRKAMDSIDLSNVPIDPQGRFAVVLQADLTGSTKILQALDRDEWGKVLGEFAARMSKFVEDREGFFDKFTGDGFLAFWLEDKDVGENYRWPKILFSRVLPELVLEFKRFQNSPAVQEALRNAGQQTTDFKPRIAVGFGPVRFGRFGRSGSAVGSKVVQVARMLDSSLPFWKDGAACVLDDEFVTHARCTTKWITDNQVVFPAQTIRDFDNITTVYTLS